MTTNMGFHFELHHCIWTMSLPQCDLVHVKQHVQYSLYSIYLYLVVWDQQILTLLSMRGLKTKKKHVATCGWLGTAQVNSLGCVPGRGILLFIYGHKWGHVFGWSSESLTFMMVLDRRVSGSTLGFQSHLVTLCKPFRRHFQLMRCE